MVQAAHKANSTRFERAKKTITKVVTIKAVRFITAVPKTVATTPVEMPVQMTPASYCKAVCKRTVMQLTMPADCSITIRAAEAITVEITEAEVTTVLSPSPVDNSTIAKMHVLATAVAGSAVMTMEQRLPRPNGLV